MHKAFASKKKVVQIAGNMLAFTLFTAPVLSHALKMPSLPFSSLFSKSQVNQPAELPAIEQPSANAQLVSTWRQKISGSNEQDPLRLSIASNGQYIVAASRKGEVEAWTPQGKSIWKVDLKDPITGGVALGDDTAVISLKNGKLVALDVASGQTRWQRPLGSSVMAPALISKGRVVVISNDGTVYGTDLATGKPVWSYDMSMPNMSVRGTPAPILLNEDTVLVSSGSGRIYGLDLLTGIPQFENRVAYSQGKKELDRLIDIDGEPLVQNRMVYVVSYQGQLVGLDMDQQRVVWAFDTSSLKTPVAAIGNIYVVRPDGVIQAVDERTGQLQWSNRKLFNRKLSNAVVMDSWLIVGDKDGYLHSISLVDGKIASRAKVNGAVRDLKKVNDQIYIQTSDGDLSIWQLNKSAS